MELIYKIGADQQNLQQTVARMKEQFRTMNMSTPVSWAPNNAYRSQYGRIMTADAGAEDAGGGFFGKAGLKRLFGVSLKGGALVAATAYFEKFADWLSQKFSDQFWENIYGINDAMTQRVQQSLDTLKKSVASVIELRAKAQEADDRHEINGLTPDSKVEVLERRLAAARKETEAAQKEYDYRVQAARASTGLNGKPLSAAQQMEVTADQARAEQGLIKARLKKDDITEALRAAFDESIQAHLKDKPARDKSADKTGERGEAFRADAMAQAGLFTGSSLLANPSLTLEQQQLDVLRQINENIGSKGMFLK